MEFYKYQGAGNDFIIIDDRQNNFKVNVEEIEKMCDRRFGIGADGLMLLQSAEGYDFRMVYFNADGNESTMCGNGGRCIVQFAKYLGVIESSTQFIAIDGPHRAKVENDEVNLEMIDVISVEEIDKDFYLNTGSPHYVRFVNNVSEMNVVNEGRIVRNSTRFKEEGTNVNFIQTIDDETIAIRTYERGVEDETLACGTGVTAAAIVYGMQKGKSELKVNALGGNLEVKFEMKNNHFQNVWLKGPAKYVFKGEF